MTRTRDALRLGRLASATAALAAAAFLLAPASALAQACLGSPNLAGQTSLQGNVTFNGDFTGYGGDLRANLPGAPSVRIGGEITDVEGQERNIREARGDLALDLATTREFSICPVAGISYSTWRDDFFDDTLDLSEVRVPFGLGLGTRLEVDGTFALIPSALLGGYWYRLRDGVETNGFAISERRSGTEFFGEAGATVALGQVYLRGTVLGDSRDDEDTRYRVALGFIF
jgi:hypothetical protein